MWVVDALSIAGGSLLVITVLHLVVFWVARFLYPPKPRLSIPPPPPPPTPIMMPVQQAPPPPQVALPLPAPANPPPVPPSYVESALHAQVPVVDHGPLPPPLQVGKRSENEQERNTSG